jgi:heme-degrading monooxygenase HmoA
MIAVIFEVWPQSEKDKRVYLDLAASLRPLLEGRDGFLSIERFQSLTDAEKVLSLSFWRDETAVEKWRREEPHIAAQLAGRNHLFRDYRLRVATVSRDYGLAERAEAPPEFQDR